MRHMAAPVTVAVRLLAELVDPLALTAAPSDRLAELTQRCAGDEGTWHARITRKILFIRRG